MKIYIDTLTVCCDHRRHHHPIRLRTIGPVSEQALLEAEGSLDMAVTVLTDTQKAVVTYSDPKDKKGKKASIQKDSLVWKTSDAAIATVTPGTETPIQGTIVAGDLGVCEIWPEADADLGDGVKAIAGEHVAIQVVGGEAVAIGGAVVGTPTEQDAPE